MYADYHEREVQAFINPNSIYAIIAVFILGVNMIKFLLLWRKYTLCSESSNNAYWKL